jgi:hypothetical protein
MHSISRTNRSNADWMARTGRVLFSWSVFHPDGPTFYSLGLTDVEGNDGQSEVFWRWMHPLAGESYCLGHVDLKDPGNGAEFVRIVRRALAAEAASAYVGSAPLTVVPNFVISPNDERWSSILRNLLAETPGFQQADWGRQFYYLSKYGPQFFPWAVEEAREICERAKLDPSPEAGITEFVRRAWQRYERNPVFADWKPGRYQSRRMQPGDIEKWWDTVTGREFRTAALVQVAQAWVGASQMASADLPVRTTFEDLRDFLARFQHACWPADWTTQQVAAGMGLGAPA